MQVQTTIKEDFSFQTKDQNNNTYIYCVSLKESTMTMEIKNNGQMQNGQVIESYHNGFFAIREVEHGGVEVFQNGWQTPCEEMVEAYSNYIAERKLLGGEGNG